MHCAEREGIDFEACFDTAKEHYRAQRREEANPFGIECPQCGEAGEIDIKAAVWVRLCPDGTNITAANGDHEWDDASPATCGNCGHSGTVEGPVVPDYRGGGTNGPEEGTGRVQRVRETRPRGAPRVGGFGYTQDMRTITTIAGLLLLIAGALYFYYVRGVGISPQISAPAAIERGGRVRSYTFGVSAAMPTPRTEVASAVLAGKIYVIGGFDGLGRTVASVEVYDPALRLWAAGPDLPAPRHHMAIVTAGNILYALGGYSGSGFEPHAEAFALDVGALSWRPVAPLPEARGAMAAAALDGKVFVVGGVGTEGLANELYVYDTATDRWEDRRPAPTRRDHLAAAALHGQLYVAGGREQTLSKNLATLEIYDPVTDTWGAGPEMPTARGGVAGAAFDGLFVVAGGERPGATHAEVEAFDPETRRWLSLPPLPTARHGLAAAVSGNVLYLIGGGKHPGLSVSDNVETLEVR